MKAAPLLIFAALLTVSCVSFEAGSLLPGATSAAFAGRSLDEPGLRQFLAGQRAGGPWTVD